MSSQWNIIFYIDKHLQKKKEEEEFVVLFLLAKHDLSNGCPVITDF